MSAKSPKAEYILYLDTSEETAVLAIYEGEKKIKEKKWLAGRTLSLTLCNKYGDLLKSVKLKKEDLSGICIFSGPGSFTGLRIGISFANGLSFALNIPIYESKKKNTLDLSTPKKIALPHYGAPPKITKPKK